MPAASNTSPLFNLAAIDQLHLLRRAFDEVLVPGAVIEELEPVRHYPGVKAIHQAIAEQWIVVKPVRDRSRVWLLEKELGRGEAEAIALAKEHGLRHILIDEREGSRIAEQAGLEPVGVLGILLRAKREGALASVESAMIVLREDVGFYIRQDLFRKILELAGERT